MSLDAEPPEITAPPVTEAVIADAVGAQATEASGHHRPIHTHCENCGTELRGPFCHKCGQHDIDFQRSFGHMFLDALENFFHFDEKLFRNIVTLLFRPGRLTAAFNAGHRAAQMPPLRLYIFVSVLFFFISFLGAESIDGKQTLGDHDPSGLKAAAPAKPAAKIQLEKDGKDGALARYLTEKGQYAYEHQPEIKEKFIHLLPKMLLVCLPFFALYTRALFRKSGLVYLQHLVLALHFHTFIYLWQLFANGWVSLARFVSPTLAALLDAGASAWLMLYAFLMLRHLFANSWPRTVVKTFLLAGAYTLTLGLGFLATGIVIFLMV